jgi:hypothetical protein
MEKDKLKCWHISVFLKIFCFMFFKIGNKLLQLSRIENPVMKTEDWSDSFIMLYFFFLLALKSQFGLRLPPWNSPFHFSFLDLRHSVELLGRMISSSQGKCRKTQTQALNLHALSGIRTCDPGLEDSACLRPLGYRDRHAILTFPNFRIYFYSFYHEVKCYGLVKISPKLNVRKWNHWITFFSLFSKICIKFCKLHFLVTICLK